MSSTPENDWCELCRAPIDANAAVRHVRADQDGAIVTFDGFVRNESHGRRTLYLEYEAYESMALTKMHEICALVRNTYAVHRIAILHRLCHRHFETYRPHLEEGVLRGRRCLGRWRTASGTSGSESCILTIR